MKERCLSRLPRSSACAPEVEVRSAVGAGDSFVDAMTLGLALGRPLDEAFALTVAAGTGR
jgi:6-phosphofructokinase 2